MTTPPSETYDIADQYVERAAALDPVAATFRGLAGHDEEMTDYSPDAFEERVEHARTGIRKLDARRRHVGGRPPRGRCDAGRPRARHRPVRGR